MRASIARAGSSLCFVLGKPPRDVGGDPSVDTLIGAFKKIYKVEHEIKLASFCYNIHMHITKLGHCCLVLENNGTKILTDPGSFTIEPVKAVTGINIILITHEHTDHYHIEAVQEVLKKNPGAVVVSNSAVAKLLAEKNIPCTVVGDVNP